MLEFDKRLNLIKQAKYKYSLQNVAEPNLYREIYDYKHIPKIAFNMRHVPEDMPDEIWITDTTFRDGQQSVSPFKPEQIEHLFKLESRLGGPKGLIRQSEFFLYTDRDREALERKRRAMGDQGALALDDWGSGYSNSNSLLELSPDYIKVDITIICDIDTDADKQQLVKDIVEYAHGRGMKIVAEGIETEAELRKVIELGVDLLQGYFLAKPAASPSEIAPQALSVIRWMNR